MRTRKKRPIAGPHESIGTGGEQRLERGAGGRLWGEISPAGARRGAARMQGRYSRRMSRESSVYDITARRLIRAASAWRGLMSTLWVSGTNTQRTINNAVSPSFSQRSPQARVIPMRRDPSVGNCASSTACRDTSSGMSILMKRCRASAAGSRTSLCTRISRIAVAGFGAQ